MDRRIGPADQRTRREALRGVAGLAAVGVAGCLGGDDDRDIESDTYGDWFAGVDNFDGTDDWTDEDAILVAVGAAGGLAFDPPAVRVETGTTIIWEWTGQGGGHNVVAENGAFESETHRDSGTQFEHTFGEPGVYRYLCTPHQTSGMKGAVHVVEG